MKVVFIEPPYGKFIERLDAPFALMYLAGTAEKCGWDAEIVDMQNIDDPIPEADVYAVTSSSPQFPVTVELEKRLRIEFPHKLRILGGNHISAMPNDLDLTTFHVGVVGEGENALQDILLNPKLHRATTRVVVKGEPVELLDEIPFPARHLVDWTKYKRGIYWGKKELSRAVSMISSRGCPNQCVYCGSHVTFGRRTRFRSVENVTAEMQGVMDTIGWRGFNFHDDTFNLDRKRTIALNRAFAEMDIVYRCLCRVDRVDEEVLSAMKKGGCKEIIYGIESGSQTILNNIRKGTTVKMNLKAMQMTKKAGIQVKAGIMVGNPGETKETVEETKKLLRECPPDFWAVSVFSPFPGCAVWENPEKFGIKILSRDLGNMAMVGSNYKGTVVTETKEMTKEDLENARDELIDLLLDVSGPTYTLKDKPTLST